MASVSLGPMVTSAAACTAGTPLPIATPVPASRSISRSAKSSPKAVIRSMVRPQAAQMGARALALVAVDLVILCQFSSPEKQRISQSGKAACSALTCLSVGTWAQIFSAYREKSRKSDQMLFAQAGSGGRWLRS